MKMKLYELLSKISTKDEFIAFIEQLKNDKLEKPEEWENSDIESYLTGISSWVDDMDGYYKNLGKNIPSNINWNFIATLFYVGKIYE